MTDAVSSVGARYSVGDGGTPETYTVIGRVRTIVAPNLSADAVDVSSLDSGDGYRQYVIGKRDAGDIALECFWNATTGQRYLRDNLGGANVGHIVEFPDGTVLEATGVIRNFEIKGDPSVALIARVEVRLTGTVTITVGAELDAGAGALTMKLDAGSGNDFGTVDAGV